MKLGIIIASIIIALTIATVLRRRDRCRPDFKEIDLRKMRPDQIAYSLLFAYPFCLVYVFLELSF